MKTWYKAVCDTHKEMCDVIVNNPLTTAHLLGEHNNDIHQWLSLHYSCHLRLIHFDDEKEKCGSEGYADIFLDDSLNKVKKPV